MRWKRFHKKLSVLLKVNWIRSGTPEKVNKCRLHWRCLDAITTPPKFPGFSGSPWDWWNHDSALLEPGQFSVSLWSPSWYSYLLEMVLLRWCLFPRLRLHFAIRYLLRNDKCRTEKSWLHQFVVGHWPGRTLKKKSQLTALAPGHSHSHPCLIISYT